ncbi:MAG: penicillin-binding protein 1C [Coleofasciculaceae cyanobacterium]
MQIPSATAHNLFSLFGKPFSKAATVILVLGLGVRSLPYLAPIQAEDLVQEQQAIEFSDRNNLPLGTVLTRDQEHTAVVPLAEISPQFIHAILAAEDGRFYYHGPLEMRAIVRSIIQAVEAKSIVSGASTITMQLARMLEPAPRTLPAKIREIWLSWRLDAGMSKDEILAAYINRLPMGGNIYGTEAAARIYFGLPAADLNLAQASLLAGLPNNPVYLNPYDYWQLSKKRQKYVLRRMVEDEYISQAQADKAYAEEITLQPRQQGIFAAAHFLFWLAGQLPQEHPSQIKTTLDRPLQQFVEAQVQQVIKQLTPHNAHHAAAVVIDNHSGEVLAYVGSPDYFNELAMGRNDGVQALRQAGSTLKPFLYQLALENRLIKPNTILADVPTHYAIPGAKLYSPTDYDETFQGPVRVRVALANSLNVPAVRVLEKVGVSSFLQRLHQLGFKSLNKSPNYYGLGLALGSGEVSLWKLAQAYFIMASQGENKPIVTNFNDINTEKSDLIGTESTWELITSMLSDRHARAQSFGVNSVLNLPFPAAVKTGTSSNFRDTWTVGFSTDYTVATWVGNFDGEPMQQVSGVMGAAPLWHRIMLHLHENKEPGNFPTPVNMVQKPICTLSGLPPTSDCPSVVQEYLFPEDLLAYQNNLNNFAEKPSSGSHLNLPKEYDEWLVKQQQPNLVSPRLRILSPHNDDVFLVAVEASTKQRLEFKLTGATGEPVEWWLNGQQLKTNSSSSFFWVVRPGDWTLQVKSGEMSEEVNFQVKLAEDKLARRGFSVASPEGKE